MTPSSRAEAVSPQKAAALMDVSESTILRLIRSGKLKATRIGRQWRIAIVDLRRGTADKNQ
jgi:excisionase family DNA binding protein